MVRLLPQAALFAGKLYLPSGGSTEDWPSWFSSRLRDVIQHLGNKNDRTILALPSSLDGRQMWRSILETQPHSFPALKVRYEYRYPLLDRDLVEFLLCVPPEQIRRPGNRRSLMRRAMRGIVPTEVLERKRKAFPARATSLFPVEHRHEINALFRESQLGKMGYIDETSFRRQLAQSTFDQVKPLMRMIGLELWLKNGLVTSNGAGLKPQRIRVKRTALDVHFMRKFRATRGEI